MLLSLIDFADQDITARVAILPATVVVNEHHDTCCAFFSRDARSVETGKAINKSDILLAITKIVVHEWLIERSITRDMQFFNVLLNIGAFIRSVSDSETQCVVVYQY